jgi:Flp pilus assembly secretin CpaC
MILPVTEDNTSIVRGIGRNRTPRQPRPAPTPPGNKFVAHVYDMTEAATQISVPLNKSVIIETSEPLQRVQAVSADIAYVQSISSMQLLITGNTYGVTHVIAWTEAGDKHVFEVSVELDVATLNETLKKIEPDSTAEASSVMGNIVLSGRVSGPETTRRAAGPAAVHGGGGEPHRGPVPGHQRVHGRRRLPGRLRG